MVGGTQDAKAPPGEKPASPRCGAGGGLSKLCTAPNRSRGQHGVGEVGGRAGEVVGETRFALHPGSSQRVTPPSHSLGW